MKKNKESYLTFEEELLVAVYYNNVEKLKWLLDMDYFNPSMITEPRDFGDVSIPLYWLTICYHYMLRYEEYNHIRKPVDEILALWKERFHLDTDVIIDLKSCYHDGKIPPVVKDDDKWWMGHLSLSDFIRSGAREKDYDLYKAICRYNVNNVILQLQKGGLPDAKVIDKDGNIRSAISMFRYWKRNREYYLWGEETLVEKWRVESLIRNGLEEMILFLLEESLRNREDIPVETFSEDVDMAGFISSDDYKPSPEIKERIDSFIRDIDNPGSVLTLFDEGKVFARCRHLDYQALYAYIIRKIFKESRYIVVRVGGYSDRVSQMAINLAKDQPEDRVYVEYLSNGTADDEWLDRDSRIRIVGMGKYKFKPGMDIVKQAEDYDFKSFGSRHAVHTMVYYYVNNIDTGWYDSDGEFSPFYNKYRGLQAITDVVMINGFDDISPATAAMCTFTFDSTGDILLAGGTIHKDRRSRTSSQKMLIERAGIKLLDLTHKS